MILQKYLNIRTAFVILFALVVFSKASHGQILISLLLGDELNTGNIEFGLEGGFNWATITNMETASSLRTFNLGFYFDIKIDDPWSLYTGVLVKANLGVDELTEDDLNFLGTETYEEEGNYSQEMRYFLVPVLMRYTFENKIFAEAGLQFGLMYNAWVEFNSDIENREARIKEDNEDMINRIDAGVMAGIGYRLRKDKGVSFAIKYYYGFVDVYKDRSGTKNSSFFLEATIPIGAG